MRAATMVTPAGEADNRPLRHDFDRSVKVEIRGAAISSDGGLLHIRHVIGTGSSGKSQRTPDCEQEDCEGIPQVIHVVLPSPQPTVDFCRSGPSIY